MTKTLAQMTGKEREECRGMWCDCGSRLRPVVLSYVNHRQGYFISPASGTGFVEVLTRVTPRFDLPRAWQPDGTPLAGEWDYRAPYLGKYGEGLTDTEIAEFKAGGDQLERRWVGEWGPINA